MALKPKTGMTKKAEKKAAKAEKKEAKLVATRGNMLFNERWKQAEATSIPKYFSLCMVGCFFGIWLGFYRISASAQTYQSGAVTLMCTLLSGYMGYHGGFAAGIFIAFGYFLPDPAYREWSKKKYDAGRYYTFAAGDTVILRGLGTELNGLLAWVVIPMPKTSTDYNFRSNEKFVIEPIIILTANMMPSKEKLDKAEVMNGRDMQVIGAARERMVNGRMHNEMQ
eukprot:gene12296-14341_t